MQINILKVIFNNPQTVYSFIELLMTTRSTKKNLQASISYYISTGDLYHIRRGLYAKNANYNKLELATKILTPAYISFETVLRSAGIVFQYYSQIFVASYKSREIICNDQTYTFKSIKSKILTNPLGVKILDSYSIATPERAFLDIIYLNKNYYFDNLEPLNWDKVYEILPIYNNKSMQKRVKMYHNAFKDGLI